MSVDDRYFDSCIKHHVINLINTENEIPKEEFVSNINKIHPAGPVKDSGEWANIVKFKSDSYKEKIFYSRSITQVKFRPSLTEN